MNDDSLLRNCLRFAVPLWLEDLKGKSQEWLDARREVCSKVIASKGDIILYRGKVPGKTADAFNHLAEGIAILILISRHPFEIFGLRFLPDGNIERASDET